MTSNKPTVTYLTDRQIPSGVMHYCFVGMKHSGKSSLAQAAASYLGLPWFDSDHLISKAIPKELSLREFYRREGAAQFMKLEHTHISRLFQEYQETPFVLSLGGGACDNRQLIELCRSRSVLIFLDAPVKVLYNRILAGGIPPFLDSEDPWGSFLSLFARRSEAYGCVSDLVVHIGQAPLEAALQVIIDHIPDIQERYYGGQ